MTQREVRAKPNSCDLSKITYKGRELVLLNRIIMGMHYSNYTLNRQTQQLLKMCLF